MEKFDLTELVLTILQWAGWIAFAVALVGLLLSSNDRTTPLIACAASLTASLGATMAIVQIQSYRTMVQILRKLTEEAAARRA